MDKTAGITPTKVVEMQDVDDSAVLITTVYIEGKNIVEQQVRSPQHWER